MNRENAKEAVYLFLEETSAIFNLIKKYSILVEELLPEKKAPIHTANELKSLVFHLYNANGTPEEINTNILEAKEHLCRAFYDLHCMVISIYIKQAVDKVKQFRLTTVTSVCPEYHQTIKPQMRDIQENLREIRTHRNTDINYLQINLQKFEEHTKMLGKIDDIIESYYPEFNQYEEEQLGEKKAERNWDIKKIIIGIAVSVALLVGGFLLGRVFPETKAEIKTEQLPATKLPKK